MRRLSAVLFVLVVGLPGVRGQAGEKSRPMTVDDVMKVRYITETAIAPDGAHVVYVVSEADLKQGRYNSDLWMVPFDGGAPVRLTAAPGRDDAPRWAPDGKQIAFISDRSGTPQVWLISPTGGEATKLTDSKTAVRDVVWSPDGKQIAYIAREPDTADEAKRKQDKADVIVVGKDKMDHLHVIPASGGPSKQLTHGAFSVLNFSWSPDGKQLAYAAAPSWRPEDVYRSDLNVLPATGGKPRALVRREGMDQLPKWSPDGKTIAFVSGDGKLDWLGNTYLCLVPAEGGDPRNVSRKFDDRIDSFDWAPDGTRFYFTADWSATRQLFALSASTGELDTLTSGERLHAKYSLSRDGRRIALLVEDPMTPREVYVAELPKLQPKRLTTTNPQLAGVALGKVEELLWRSDDGLRLQGLLIKPVGYQGGKRYPLLTYIHGGPALQFAHGFSVYPPGPPQASRYPIHGSSD
jgi:dipeptidyl aminopeptidase/acylaminoacyl peptidase